MARMAAEFGAADAHPRWVPFPPWMAVMENLKPQVYSKGACQETNEPTEGILGEMFLSRDFGACSVSHLRVR